ncbi:hypothetical protein N657DRAFT_243285 [Parathielavia appendiculata]|uniref:Uncharacterized protein n=1 Tax=Parathielavia appendiculata TaxID=2587402 RepID=A0AAN6TSG2_9PEZI|nr:hypothetical protein N657DRAFT_243285 [Parathielavia appendiculata]
MQLPRPERRGVEKGSQRKRLRVSVRMRLPSIFRLGWQGRTSLILPTICSSGPICLAVVEAEAARPRHLFGPHRPPCRQSLTIPARCSLESGMCPGIDCSCIRRPTCRFRNRSSAGLAAAILGFGPIATKGSSPICRPKRPECARQIEAFLMSQHLT